MSISVTTGQGD